MAKSFQGSRCSSVCLCRNVSKCICVLDHVKQRFPAHFSNSLPKKFGMDMAALIELSKQVTRLMLRAGREAQKFGSCRFRCLISLISYHVIDLCEFPNWGGWHVPLLCCERLEGVLHTRIKRLLQDWLPRRSLRTLMLCANQRQDKVNRSEQWLQVAQPLCCNLQPVDNKACPALQSTNLDAMQSRFRFCGVFLRWTPADWAPMRTPFCRIAHHGVFSPVLLYIPFLHTCFREVASLGNECGNMSQFSSAQPVVAGCLNDTWFAVQHGNLCPHHECVHEQDVNVMALRLNTACSFQACLLKAWSFSMRLMGMARIFCGASYLWHTQWCLGSVSWRGCQRSM